MIVNDPVKVFQSKYPDALEVNKTYVPYRVCPIGAHSDHQHGKILGFAIDKGVNLVYSIRDDSLVVLDSLDFSGSTVFDIHSIPDKQGNWGDYARAVAFALQKKYDIEYGIEGIVAGSLPVGGLSSSAAVCLCYLNALASANDIKLSNTELIELSYIAEKEYVGINVGTLDMSCEVLCEKDKLLYLDTQNDRYELINKPDTAEDFLIAIIYSGVSRHLSSGFNMRVDEVRTAAYSLKAYADLPYGLFEDTRLREVPIEVYMQYKDRLPYNMRKRAEHFYTEFQRVEKGAELFKQGDIKGFGKLVFESGYSSIYNWETGSSPLISIYSIMTKTEGIYGGRFSGAGFNGCCVALVDPSYTESIKESITKEYLAEFPEYTNTFSIHYCKTDNGLGIHI